MDLSASILPGGSFDLLLGLTWIFKSGVGLETKCRVLVHHGKEHPFENIFILEPPKEVVTTVIYAKEHFQVPPMGYFFLKVGFFKKGSHSGHAQP